MTLLWTPVVNATGYVVERAWQMDGPFVTLGTTGETIYRDTAPVAAVAFYRVRATGNGATSNSSPVQSATVMPAPASTAKSPFAIALGASAAPAPPPGSLTLGSTQSAG